MNSPDRARREDVHFSEWCAELRRECRRRGVPYPASYTLPPSVRVNNAQALRRAYARGTPAEDIGALYATRRHGEAPDAYQATHARCAALGDRIAEGLRIRRFDYANGAVTWAHVEELEAIAGALQDLGDRLLGEGEYRGAP